MHGATADRDGEAIAHGGNLDDARARYGTPEAGWLDLSTGINPHPYPLPELPRSLWTALPQAAGEAALTRAAAHAYAAPSPATVVPAPGTQALIQVLPRVLGHDRAAVVGPTYGEYAPAWRAAGAEVREVGDAADGLSALEGASRPALVLCNPNNPDGRTWPPQALVFAVCNSSHAASIGRALGPWSVPGPALEVGRAALADAAWQTAMRARLAADAERLGALLTAAGLDTLGGTALYQLAAHPDAAGWHDRLARQGIWVRAFQRQPTWLRFGLPGAEAGWRALAAALERHA